MWRVAAGKFPFLAQHDTCAFRHDQHRGHAQRMRHFEIAGEVLEDRGTRRIDLVTGEESLIDPRPWFGFKLGGPDIEYVFEVLFDAEPAQHGIGMMARAVGEYEFAARQLGDGRAQRGIGLERRMIDLMHDFKKLVRLEPVLLHQAAHRRAVAAIVVLLQPERLVMGDFEKVYDVIADAYVDLLPEIEMMRIERVVEVEHPGVDMVEPAFGRIADGARRLPRTCCCHDFR